MFKTREGLTQRPAYADIASIPRRLSRGPVPRLFPALEKIAWRAKNKKKASAQEAYYSIHKNYVL